MRFQSNVDEHDPEVCYKNVTAWEKYGACEKLPKFVPFGMNVSLTVGNHYPSSRFKGPICSQNWIKSKRRYRVTELSPYYRPFPLKLFSDYFWLQKSHEGLEV